MTRRRKSDAEGAAGAIFFLIAVVFFVIYLVSLLKKCNGFGKFIGGAALVICSWYFLSGYAEKPGANDTTNLTLFTCTVLYLSAFIYQPFQNQEQYRQVRESVRAAQRSAQNDRNLN